MIRKTLAVAGALALGMVALFALFNALKAVLALAFIAFAGRGLMRLWHSGSYEPWQRRRHRFNAWNHRHDLHRQYDPEMDQTPSWSGVQPQYQHQSKAETIVPIW